MNEPAIIGCDPGASGAIAAISAHDGRLLWVEDAPVVDGLVSAPLLAGLLEGERVRMAVIERVGSMPGQGVSSTFKFGMSTGTLHGVVGALRFPVELVTPTVWKRAMGLSSDKELSRRRAIELWPMAADRFRFKKHDGRAEAALLARWWFDKAKR